MKEIGLETNSMMTADKIKVIIITKHREYEITNVDEYKRILNTINTEGKRFVKIYKDFININTIELIKNMEVEYISYAEMVKRDMIEEPEIMKKKEKK